MIVATAGHIDHGKTRLVKALTGADTDRLPEEKARGISIDLGFAYLPLAAGGEIGFVDVPGHERFIHNMLAGVSGIDFALLVVAADDGVMPQTREHLQILDLLGIGRGVVALTKTDRVDLPRTEHVRREVHDLLKGTALADTAVMPVSAVTGDGIERLRAALVAAAEAHRGRYQEGQLFRFAVDRAFSIAGSGTVVTGTVFNGEVARGDALVLSPAGAAVRVRGLQVRGKAAERARAGMRCALNVSGVEVGAVRRGDWLLHESLHAPSARMDARLHVLPGETLSHWMRVHLYLGTAEVMARVATARAAPGFVQLVLERPVAALAGDRFIVRDQAAGRTLGGGGVIDPFAAPARRASAARAAELAALEHAHPREALEALLRIPRYALDCARFQAMFCLSAQAAEALYRQAHALCMGRERRVALPSAVVQALRARIPERLAAFHAGEPQAPGMNVERLHEEIAPWLGAEAFGFLLRGLADAHAIGLEGTLAKAAGFDATSNPADDLLWQRVQPALLEAGFLVPTAAELAKKLALDERALVDFLHRKSRTGALLRVSQQRFYPKATLAVLAANAALVARFASRGLFSAAQYRDACGINRGVAIEILEYLDTLGVTQRIGDLRKMHKNFVPILGAAKPALVNPIAKKPATAKRR